MRLAINDTLVLKCIKKCFQLFSIYRNQRQYNKRDRTHFFLLLKSEEQPSQRRIIVKIPNAQQYQKGILHGQQPEQLCLHDLPPEQLNLYDQHSAQLCLHDQLTEQLNLYD
jgi:hypothetical protein